MAKVLFKRYETDAEAQASNIVDGQFIVTKEGTSYTDYGTDRVAFGGTLDTQMSDSSINGVQNKVIKGYVDNEVSDGVQEVKDYVDEKQTYSTTETVIGTWLGKPLYRKVVDLGNLPNSTTKRVSTGLNMSIINTKRLLGYGKHSQNNGFLTIPGTNITMRLTQTEGDIYIDATENYSTWTGWAILEYTKTTD